MAEQSSSQFFSSHRSRTATIPRLFADQTTASARPDRASPAVADRLSARLVLNRLADLDDGEISIVLPDGHRHRFGPSGSLLAGEMRIHRWSVFRRLLVDGDIGLGEAYVAGDWTTPDLVALARVLLAHEDALDRRPKVTAMSRFGDRLLHLMRANTRRQARRNIRAHYDLGNPFYETFLDRTMTYSSAFFPRPDSDLEEAQIEKYRRMADMAGLQPGMHVLEIGCGWGGFAEYAARERGCRVTGLTLSDAQAAFARDRMKRQGLDTRVSIELLDYRDIRGQFDAVVSIEMLEAVGHRFLEDFFAACDRVLAPNGRVAIQVISIPDQIYDTYRRGTDWIRKHIFPGGHLPSLGAIQGAMARRSSLVIRQVDDIAWHYAETLRRWRVAFNAHRDRIEQLGFDSRFIRMWNFYLGICEAAFAHRKLGTLQLALARSGDAAAPSAAVSGGAS